MHHPSISRKNYTPEDMERVRELSRRLIDFVCESASDKREIARWMEAMLAVTGVFAANHPAALDVAADMVTVASHIMQSALPASADKAQASTASKNYTPEDMERASELSRRLIDFVCESASDERDIAHWMQAMLSVAGFFAANHPAALDVAADMVTVASHIMQSALPASADKAQASTATHAPAPDSPPLH